MAFERVAIIGTNCMSVSIALGLAVGNRSVTITGWDSDVATAKQARALGAFTRVERRLERACRDSDAVIVSVPLCDLRETFIAIAPQLHPGCLVTDTAPLKAPVMGWAEELLPDNVFFVGGHVIPNPAVAGLDALDRLERASADLLKEALYCFTTPTDAPQEVVDALVVLASLLGAQPLFIDVAEHDGLQAAVDGLPSLLAVALLRATMDTGGWLEMRKFAAYRFAAGVEASYDGYGHHTEVFLNRKSVLLRLNVLLSELVRLREILTSDDSKALEETFSAAGDGRTRWIQERRQGMWVSDRAVRMDHVPKASERAGRLFFGDYITSRLSEGPEGSR